MAKIYSKEESFQMECVAPKKETISLLLSYSKALRIVEHKNIQFKSVLN
ncbi:hypothetical protein [Neptunitalea chrysea]|nr:hypothetical protein [Neptunitalea chrysea]